LKLYLFGSNLVNYGRIFIARAKKQLRLSCFEKILTSTLDSATFQREGYFGDLRGFLEDFSTNKLKVRHIFTFGLFRLTQARQS